ncbi:MAG: pyrroloquinoline quinone-dependent dehydrogenase, partial [Oricola sp.]|nr:pyrroloquinoline quinone-dependent dehydrogenase [Oricola sp.]
NLYMCSAMNVLISVDAATGEERWRYDPEVSTESIPYGATCRGVAFYRNPEAAADEVCAARVVEATLDARLIEVDAETGEPCANFGENGSVDLNEGIWKNDEVIPGWYAVTAPPVIVRGVVVTGAQVSDGEAEDAPSGVIRGYDAVTGELAWAWDLANPDLTGAPPQGETYTRGTPNMWTTAVADEQLGYVYVPLGNSAVDYYGGNRSDAENEFSTSLVALDATTGEPVWHFQTVHYDVWDYDLGSQATLVDFPEDGGTVPAIILPSKQGDIYVLNRETGESLFPVEEMDAPTGGVEPENISPTQPVSSYATLRKPDLTEKDMWGATPLDQLWCRIQFRRAAYDGIYTPPTVDRHWIQYPGYNGGSDWGSVAVDPERGLIIANYNDMPNHNGLLTREEADKRNLRTIVQKYEDPESGQSGGAEGEGDPQAGSPYAIDVNAGWRVPLTGMLCKEPPYGWIRAIDLKTGETVWDEPLGSARQNGPFGIPSMLPLTIGTPNNGGSVVTAGGVIFVAATTDNMIRAIDEKTGKVLWEDTLPGGGQANPMTYEVDGRQYLVIA